MPYRPFELKCFKEPKRISRKELYQLYTRPLMHKRVPTDPNIDTNLIHHELEFVDVQMNIDEQPRELIPIPADYHQNSMIYPNPNNTLSEEQKVETAEISTQTQPKSIHEDKNIKPTTKKKQRQKQRKLSKWNLTEY